MKLRNREINVFSMSALDLFASGMGAFILLTLMGMLFFPNTGDSDERVANIREELKRERRERTNLQSQLSEAQRQRDDAEARLNEAQRQRDDAEAQRSRAQTRVTEAEQELKKVKIPDLDLVICLDVTGSMSDRIEGLKREINDLANVLDSLAPSAGIGVVAFGDRKYQTPIRAHEIVSTTRMAGLKAFVSDLTPGMNDPRAENNNDSPEAVARALVEAVGLNWRSQAQRRFIVVVTDAPAYPEKAMEAVTTARAFATNSGHQVSTVMAHRGSDDPQRFLSDLADAGNGEFIDATGGQTLLAGLLLAVLGS